MQRNEDMQMKKQIAAIALSAMLMLALPAFAWAAPSPTGQTATTDTGVSMTVSAGSGTATVAVSSQQASNVELSGSEIALGSFEVTGDATNVTLTFSVGAQYAGASAQVFVQHGDGATEVIPATIASDGTVTVHVDRLSIFTIVVDPTTAAANGGQTGATATTAGTTGITNANTGSTSPQTGIDGTAVAGATVVCAVIAAGVGVAAYRKVNE